MGGSNTNLDVKLGLKHAVGVGAPAARQQLLLFCSAQSLVLSHTGVGCIVNWHKTNPDAAGLKLADSDHEWQQQKVVVAGCGSMCHGCWCSWLAGPLAELVVLRPLHRVWLSLKLTDGQELLRWQPLLWLLWLPATVWLLARLQKGSVTLLQGFVKTLAKELQCMTVVVISVPGVSEC